MPTWTADSHGVAWQLELERDRLLPGRLVAGRVTVTAHGDDRRPAARRQPRRRRGVAARGDDRPTARATRAPRPSRRPPICRASPSSCRVRSISRRGETRTWPVSLPVPPLGPASVEATVLRVTWAVEAKLDRPGFDSADRRSGPDRPAGRAPPGRRRPRRGVRALPRGRRRGRRPDRGDRARSAAALCRRRRSAARSPSAPAGRAGSRRSGPRSGSMSRRRSRRARTRASPPGRRASSPPLELSTASAASTFDGVLARRRRCRRSRPPHGRTARVVPPDPRDRRSPATRTSSATCDRDDARALAGRRSGRAVASRRRRRGGRGPRRSPRATRAGAVPPITSAAASEPAIVAVAGARRPPQAPPARARAVGVVGAARSSANAAGGTSDRSRIPSRSARPTSAPTR